MNIENKVFHGYECRTGCGSTILMDFKFPKRKPRCPRCGTHSTMEYKGEYGSVKPISKIDLGLEKKEMTIKDETKIYQVENQEDFDELLMLLKEDGYKWSSGEDLSDEAVRWNEYKKDTCIRINSKHKFLSYSDFDFYINILGLSVETYVSGMEVVK